MLIDSESHSLKPQRRWATQGCRQRAAALLAASDFEEAQEAARTALEAEKTRGFGADVKHPKKD